MNRGHKRFSRFALGPSVKGLFAGASIRANRRLRDTLIGGDVSGHKESKNSYLEKASAVAMLSEGLAHKRAARAQPSTATRRGRQDDGWAQAVVHKRIKKKRLPKEP